MKAASSLLASWAFETESGLSPPQFNSGDSTHSKRDTGKALGGGEELASSEGGRCRGNQVGSPHQVQASLLSHLDDPTSSSPDSHPLPQTLHTEWSRSNTSSSQRSRLKSFEGSPGPCEENPLTRQSSSQGPEQSEPQVLVFLPTLGSGFPAWPKSTRPHLCVTSSLPAGALARPASSLFLKQIQPVPTSGTVSLLRPESTWRVARPPPSLPSGSVRTNVACQRGLPYHPV